MTAPATVDELARAVASAVLALLEDGLPGVFFDGRVTARPAPNRYGVMNVSRVIGSDRLTTRDDASDWRIDMQSVGGTVDQARWVQQRAVRQLLNARVEVEGWACTPIRHTDGQPVDWDASATPELAYTVDSFRFRSDKQ